jgi:hypothetical protein
MFVFFALASVPTTVNGGKGGVGLQIFSGAFIVAAIGLSARAARMATIRVYHDGFVVRRLTRDRRVIWSDVDSVAVEVSEEMTTSFLWKIPVVHRIDGSVLRLEEFRSLRWPRSKRRLVDRLVDQLNGHLEQDRARRSTRL